MEPPAIVKTSCRHFLVVHAGIVIFHEFDEDFYKKQYLCNK